ncbi:DJ-1/PfpI family protein [Actinomadura rayongensis]|uniref:DJ-1/PfpI family protein n=1 Tax=Actinomadura rayongensis TaxID=1429076 RepID=A0A6I4WMH2_9ACTN|nr:DJ-1/PfpI family protein [Actinomadura rayongensis]MXQ67862.1 DJ-1/PfpI family protein [Actinomadura rayongensis]
MRVQIVLFDGFDPLDAVAPYEVLYAGGTASGGAVTVELVTAEGPRPVAAGIGGLVLQATAALDPDRADLILVPGAAGRLEEGEEGPDELVHVLLARALETELPALLKAAKDDPGVTLASVCGGSILLALAGLLEGRRATTHHSGLDVLATTGVHAVDARVVDDGDLVTAAGVTSGLDLGLHLLEREVGPQIAHAVETLFAHERRGIVWRDQGPAPATF